MPLETAREPHTASVHPVAAARACSICGAGTLSPATADYLSCTQCGHELLRSGAIQRSVVNDILEADRHAKPDALVRFQSSIVQRVRRSDRLLVDVGAGCGKFLYHNRDRFRSLVGIELDEASMRYAERELGLTLLRELPADLEPPSVVSFWQSLEHIPLESIDSILTTLRKLCDAGSRVVVSVPNSRSLQYRALREDYAFYDTPHHLHQFSPRSLDLLMQRHGFTRTDEFFSAPYVVFGWVQGLLNRIQPIHNYFYYRRKRGWSFDLSRRRRALLDGANWLALPIALPIGLTLSLADLFLRDSRGVMTRCYKAIDWT